MYQTVGSFRDKRRTRRKQTESSSVFLARETHLLDLRRITVTCTWQFLSHDSAAVALLKSSLSVSRVSLSTESTRGVYRN